MIRFAKLQSVGNHFALVRGEELDGRDPGLLSERMGMHRFGVGTDGLLVLTETGHGPELRMFNPDGTEDFCGNGLRCAAWFRFVELGAGEGTFSQMGKRVPYAIEGDNRVRTVMPGADYGAAAVPLAQDGPLIDGVVAGVRGSAVSTGSAHFVAFGEGLPGEEFEARSAAVERDGMFPERTSVMWAEDLGGQRVRIRIWERGVGETFGCGTGASAVAVEAVRRQGLVTTGARVAVESRGGVIEVEVPPGGVGQLVQRGHAELLYWGEFR